MDTNRPFGLIVWSKDRASQLDLLLSSLSKFAPNQFRTHVLYKGEDEFGEGYKLCSGYHPDVEFVAETDFCKQTKEILATHEYMAVSTDDTVVFKPFSLSVDDMSGVDIFSLRLGLNTTVQEPFSGRMQPALTKFVNEGRTICWDSRLYSPTDNYGFKLGHDMVVYGPKYRELVNSLSFSKTNELETKLFYLQDKINPFIRSFHHSVAVNIPSNNQSGITLADNSLPLESTNKLFLEGKRFRLDEVENMKVRGCHQCCDLKMIGT